MHPDWFGSSPDPLEGNAIVGQFSDGFKQNLMGIRSKVAVLPAAVRDKLDRLIVERAFSGYDALAEWLRAQGYSISDGSVQRYGVRLRQQLDAIKLAGHQARALAAAGKSARDTANDLVAINAQQILQQTLGILLQAPEPCASSGRSNTTTVPGAAASGNSGDPDVPTAESSEESAPAPAEPKKLDVRDLIKLTRITVDLSRTIKDQANRPDQLKDQPNAEQLKEQPRQARPSIPRARALKLPLPRPSLSLARSFAGERAGEGSALSQTCNRDSWFAATKTAAKRKGKTLSEETYQTIRNALRAPNQFAPQPEAAPPPVETSAEPAESPADVVTTTLVPEIPSQSIESASETSSPVEAQPSQLEAQPNPDEPTQPQLTAPDRIYPHQTIYRVPIESVTKWVWPTLVFPKPAPFPRPQPRTVSPDPQPEPNDKTPEPPIPSDPDRTRGNS